MKFIKKHFFKIFSILPMFLWLLSNKMKNITSTYIILFILLVLLGISILTLPKENKPKTKIYYYIVFLLGVGLFFYSKFIIK
jgi:hypothetical protein